MASKKSIPPITSKSSQIDAIPRPKRDFEMSEQESPIETNDQEKDKIVLESH